LTFFSCFFIILSPYSRLHQKWFLIVFYHFCQKKFACMCEHFHFLSKKTKFVLFTSRFKSFGNFLKVVNFSINFQSNFIKFRAIVEQIYFLSIFGPEPIEMTFFTNFFTFFSRISIKNIFSYFLLFIGLCEESS